MTVWSFAYRIDYHQRAFDIETKRLSLKRVRNSSRNGNCIVELVTKISSAQERVYLPMMTLHLTVAYLILKGWLCVWWSLQSADMVINHDKPIFAITETFWANIKVSCQLYSQTHFDGFNYLGTATLAAIFYSPLKKIDRKIYHLVMRQIPTD